MKSNNSPLLKYVKPEILSISSAKCTIQSTEGAKLGYFSDGTQTTGAAYEADE
jgi:hypothetical protein